MDRKAPHSPLPCLNLASCPAVPYLTSLHLTSRLPIFHFLNLREKLTRLTPWPTQLGASDGKRISGLLVRVRQCDSEWANIFPTNSTMLRRIPLDVGVISAKISYQKTAHSTVTFLIPFETSHFNSLPQVTRPATRSLHLPCTLESTLSRIFLILVP